MILIYTIAPRDIHTALWKYQKIRPYVPDILCKITVKGRLDFMNNR